MLSRKHANGSEPLPLYEWGPEPAGRRGRPLARCEHRGKDRDGGRVPLRLGPRRFAPPARSSAASEQGEADTASTAGGARTVARLRRRSARSSIEGAYVGTRSPNDGRRSADIEPVTRLALRVAPAARTSTIPRGYETARRAGPGPSPPVTEAERSSSRRISMQVTPPAVFIPTSGCR